MSDEGWIGVDLDGTLAFYDTWKGLDHIGKPIAAMVERVKGWLEAGKEVRIFTARVSHDGSKSGRTTAAYAINVIQSWLVCDCSLPPLQVTNVKDFQMLELWDDRAVGVKFNTGIPYEPR